MKSDVPVKMPSRVMYTSEGDATTFERAMNDHHTIPEVIFLRNDGWSLGAPKHLERYAFRMWESDWVGFAWKGEEFYSDIEDYYPSK